MNFGIFHKFYYTSYFLFTKLRTYSPTSKSTEIKQRALAIKFSLVIPIPGTMRTQIAQSKIENPSIMDMRHERAFGRVLISGFSHSFKGTAVVN